MRIAEIERSLQDYNDAFSAFINTYRLPRELFLKPDHVAIKCADELDYLDTCTALDTDASFTDAGLWEVPMDGRKLASGVLAARIGIGNFTFGWVEIMEPRPGKELDSGFVEHTEFYYPDLFGVQRELKRYGVLQFDHEENEGHAWINVTIDEAGREIKFNDNPLEKVTATEQVENNGRWILRKT